MEPASASTQGCTKMWSMYTVEYYLALKRKRLLSQAAIRMNLQDIE